MEEKTNLMTEYERTNTVNLAQLYDNERQACSIFRPTIKLNFLYDNTYTGTTSYPPLKNNLYYVNATDSVFNNKWVGFPQHYNFDIFRNFADDGGFTYQAQSAYTYNWSVYFSYAYENDYDKNLFFVLDNSSLTWKASDGIPFIISMNTINGNDVIRFNCIAPHGLTVGESVELSISYNNNNIFEVFSLGNGNVGGDEFAFTIYNVGYTGTTFSDGVVGTFKRIINADNLEETKSKYYVRKHKILTNNSDTIITKVGFEKNPFLDQRKLEPACLTPNNQERISQKNSSNTYTITTKRNLNIEGFLDNQKRPVSELFLTIVNKGYSGLFNKPFYGSGLKQGWKFNITTDTNSWWDDNNSNSTTNIQTESYNNTISGTTYTLYYNKDLNIGDIMYGDFCEWNNYEQRERVVSKYYHKLKYNQNIFQTESAGSTNPKGFYYESHRPIKVRSFSSFIETGNVDTVDLVPNYSFYSNSDQQFRWRDLYTYGFIDENNVGVDYPYLNNAHYPYEDYTFKLIPEGSNYNNNGINYPTKPLIDGCE